MQRLALVFVAVAVLASGSTSYSQRRVPVHGYTIVRSYPHDPDAFTQGLIFRDGFLYESTGQNGKSSLRKVVLETGRVVQRKALDARYFAEGLTDWGNRLIQLTYTTNVGFVYTLSTFANENAFSYTGEGWGITHDGKRLIMSDGSASLRFLNPETFVETGRVLVRADGRSVEQLNELEFVKGRVYANVWLTNRVAMIDPMSGQVTGWLDLTGLLPAGSKGHDVLNGIAYDAAADRLFVTGKLWPRLFEIKVGTAR
jgi:glutaminyl-peptide cyclotransferase